MHLLLAIALCLGLCSNESVASNRPARNFLLVEDLGWADLECFGSDFYETPNVDRLAKKGMKFTNAYAASCVCSPTRVSIFDRQNYPPDGYTSRTRFRFKARNGLKGRCR